MLDQFGRLIAAVEPGQPRIMLVSNVSGQLAGPGYGSPSYWVAHVRQPVRFADGVRAAESLGGAIFVEVGPGGGLSAAVEESVAARQPISVVTMAKVRPEAESVLTAAGRVFTAGVAVNWNAVLSGSCGRRITLPTYGFVRQRFWLDDSETPVSQVASGPAVWAERLESLPPDERRRRLLELVCAHAAIVLGHTSSHDVDAERAFQDLGFDSLAGVELRNRLKSETGLSLSRTLVFDYPTPVALAAHLHEKLLVGEGTPAGLDQEEIWSLLRRIPLHELRRAGLLDKLLLLAGEPEKAVAHRAAGDDVIDALSPAALIAMALNTESEAE
jgi:acyl transferase domain-containing protein